MDPIDGVVEYAVGTVADIHVTSKKKDIFLIAIAHPGKEIQLSDITIALKNLWTLIRQRGEIDSVSVPLVGTGGGRVNATRVEVAFEIIESFVAACKRAPVCNRLHVLIYPEDYWGKLNPLDFQKISEFLSHACDYPGRIAQPDVAKVNRIAVAAISGQEDLSTDEVNLLSKILRDPRRRLVRYQSGEIRQLITAHEPLITFGDDKSEKLLNSVCDQLISKGFLQQISINTEGETFVITEKGSLAIGATP